MDVHGMACMALRVSWPLQAPPHTHATPRPNSSSPPSLYPPLPIPQCSTDGGSTGGSIPPFRLPYLVKLCHERVQLARVHHHVDGRNLQEGGGGKSQPPGGRRVGGWWVVEG